MVGKGSKPEQGKNSSQSHWAKGQILSKKSVKYSQNSKLAKHFSEIVVCFSTVRCFVTWMFFYDDLQSFELATISTRS